MYSTHGHHIPGTKREINQPVRIRCGGFEHCEQCLREAAKVLVQSEKDHHHVLIGLSLKTAGTDQKVRGLMANAIGWTFFGIEGETIVNVSEEDTAKCRIAADRCLVALREYKKIGGDVGEIEEREDGNLVAHARRELELIGEEPEVIEWYLRTIRAFASYGHSGGSASVTIPILYELLQYKNLTPLTNHPDEWTDQSEISGTPLWQNIRRPDAFSEDGGQTYTLLNDENQGTKYHSARVDVGVRHTEESDEQAVRGDEAGESTSDEQEPTQLGSSETEEASEASEEGVV